MLKYWPNIVFNIGAISRRGTFCLYCTNIGDNIGALLAIILRQYWQYNKTSTNIGTIIANIGAIYRQYCTNVFACWNIGPILYPILAQYRGGVRFPILYQYSRQYRCIIDDHIAPILVVLYVNIVPILVHYRITKAVQRGIFNARRSQNPGYPHRGAGPQRPCCSRSGTGR